MKPADQQVSLLRATGMRLGRSIRGRVQSVRSHPALHPTAARELIHDGLGGHVVDPEHRCHLDEALAWLERAQDATPDDGFARGFSLVRDPYFGWHGWQPSYPETTGYIIPTLYAAAGQFDRADLHDRATRAAHWEVDIQLASGAVRGGVVTQTPSPAVFNTGQVLFGWLAAALETGNAEFTDAARRAGQYLVSALGQDGIWTEGRSKYARGGSELYNARTAWALAETGNLLGETTFLQAASRALHAVADRQHSNGWYPECCLSEPVRPLLHTIAYTTRGLLEGGRVLGDERLVQAAIRTAGALARTVDSRGWMPGRYFQDWNAAVHWSCLTGQAQAANNWMRLYAITNDHRWLEPVPRVLNYLKRSQNRSSRVAGLRGGIKGSAPVSGAYGRYEVLNWATKFFVDALMRHQRILQGQSPDTVHSVLA